MNPIKPMYLLAGGNWRNPRALLPALKNVLSASGKNDPTVAYVGVANGDNLLFYKGMLEMLRQAGAAEVIRVFLAKGNANVPKARQTLSSVDAVFLAGGDVEKGMRWLMRHQFTDVLRDLYRQGILFFGISAGSIMLGAQWVRWPNPKNDASAELFECIGLAPFVCDTHGEGDDWEELQAAVSLLNPTQIGYGIPTGGVLRVDAEGKATALIKPTAIFVNDAGRVQRIEDLPGTALPQAE